MTLSATVSGNYGAGLSPQVLASSEYSLAWKADSSLPAGITFESGVLSVSSSAAAGEYQISVTVTATHKDLTDLTAADSVTVSVKISPVPEIEVEPEPEEVEDDNGANESSNTESKSDNTNTESGSEKTSDNTRQNSSESEEIKADTNENNEEGEKETTSNGGVSENEPQNDEEIETDSTASGAPVSEYFEAPTINITRQEVKEIIFEAFRKISALRNIIDDSIVGGTPLEIVDITNDPGAEIGEATKSSDVEESIPQSQKIAVTFNRVKITETKIYVFKGQIAPLADGGLPKGSKLNLVLVESSFNGASVVSLAGTDSTTNGAVFFDENGNEITTTTEDNQVFNVAAYIEPGEYIPVVTSEEESDEESEESEGANTPGSSGGGCNAFSNILVLCALFAFRKIKS